MACGAAHFVHLRTVTLPQQTAALDDQLRQWRETLSVSACNHRRDGLTKRTVVVRRTVCHDSFVFPSNGMLLAFLSVKPCTTLCLFLWALSVEEISVYTGELCSQIAHCQESSPKRRTFARMISAAW